MNDEKFMRIMSVLKQLCKKATMEYSKVNPNVAFGVYQFMKESEEQSFCPYDLVEFYNENWTGNQDFMHIPNYDKMMKYIKSFPIIIAYDKVNMEILGISTMQYDEVTENHVDPYFPEMNSKYFSITGILTNPTNKFRGLNGIGNKIYEIELFAALAFKQNSAYKDTRIMCVIDCRNKHSIYALKNAAQKLGEKFKLDQKGMEFPTYITAYYIITNQHKKLTEAPTLVMEVDLEPKKIEKHFERKLEFIPDKNINESLLRTVVETFKPDLHFHPVVNKDMELGGVDVTYVKLDSTFNQLKNFSNIITNGTEKGNDRIPLSRIQLIDEFIIGSAKEEKRKKLVR